MKTILTDIDGVVLDWETAFHTWMEHKGYGTVANPRETYDMVDAYGMSYPEIKREIRIFNSSAVMGFLSPVRDSQYWIKRIHEELRYNFVSVTSMSSDPYAQKLRKQNLKKLYGNAFTEHHILDAGDDKDEVLWKLSGVYPGAIWVEDKPENYELGASLRFNAQLMEHKHNRDWAKENSASVVKNWKEVYNIVCKQMGE